MADLTKRGEEDRRQEDETARGQPVVKNRTDQGETPAVTTTREKGRPPAADTQREGHAQKR